jgi:hypothetical protein
MNLYEKENKMIKPTKAITKSSNRKPVEPSPPPIKLNLKENKQKTNEKTNIKFKELEYLIFILFKLISNKIST